MTAKNFEELKVWQQAKQITSLGFERGSNKEFIQFLFIAKGSSGELRSHLILSHERGYITTAQYEQAREMTTGQSAMLNHFIRYLQSTDMKRKRCGATETFQTSSTS